MRNTKRLSMIIKDEILTIFANIVDNRFIIGIKNKVDDGIIIIFVNEDTVNIIEEVNFSERSFTRIMSE